MFIFAVDNTPPTITCPPDVTNQINCGSSSTQVNFLATASDNCGAVSVTYTSSGATTFNQQSQSSATMNVGSSTITATATDNGGRQSTCIVRVTITAGILYDISRIGLKPECCYVIQRNLCYVLTNVLDEFLS